MALMLTMRDIAEFVGIGYQSVRVYRGRSIFNQRQGISKPWDLPEPDSYTGQTPLWDVATIEAWAQSRPRAGRKHD